MSEKYYEIWPGNQHKNKLEIHDWCYSMFGPGNIEELGWSVTSWYRSEEHTSELQSH